MDFLPLSGVELHWLSSLEDEHLYESPIVINILLYVHILIIVIYSLKVSFTVTLILLLMASRTCPRNYDFTATQVISFLL